MPEKNIIIEYIVEEDGPYIVEYKDGDEWLNASGTWQKNGAKVNVRGYYTDEGQAVHAAHQLHKLEQKNTRVVLPEGEQ